MRFEIKKFSYEERDNYEIDDNGIAFSVYDILIHVKTDVGVFKLEYERSISTVDDDGQWDSEEITESKIEDQGPHDQEIFDKDTCFTKEKDLKNYLEDIEVETKPDPKKAAFEIAWSDIDTDLEDLTNLEEKVWESSAFMWRYMFDLCHDSPEFIEFMKLLKVANKHKAEQKVIRYNKKKQQILKEISELDIKVSDGQFVSVKNKLTILPNGKLVLDLPSKFDSDNEVQQAWKNKHAELSEKASELQEELKQSIRELKQKQIEAKLNEAIELVEKAEKTLIEAMRTEFDLSGSLEKSKCSAAFKAAAKNVINKSKETVKLEVCEKVQSA